MRQKKREIRGYTIDLSCDLLEEMIHQVFPAFDGRITGAGWDAILHTVVLRIEGDDMPVILEGQQPTAVNLRSVQAKR